MRGIWAVVIVLGCGPAEIVTRPKATIYWNGVYIGDTPTTVDTPIAKIDAYAPGFEPANLTDGGLTLDLVPIRDRPIDRAMAWALLKEAQKLARERSCEAAASLGSRVRELDYELYNHVFVREVTIAGCLGKSAP